MGTKPTTETILEEVADAEGVEVLELPPLYETIDADALESLLGRTATNGPRDAIEVSFYYHGYEVLVTSDGAVEVRSE